MADTSQLAKPPRKGEPPKPADIVRNLDKPASGAKGTLQVRIASETRREFKMHAAAHDMHESDLFQQVWQYFKANHG